MPQHDTFYVIRRASPEGGAIITILNEVPTDSHELGVFADPVAATDFAQQEVRRLNAAGVAVEYVDPPESLVGTG